jgi:hypothetical protein
MKKAKKELSRFAYAMQRGGIKELAKEYSGEIYVAITAVFTISGLYFFFFIFPSLMKVKYKSNTFGMAYNTRHILISIKQKRVVF